jgi:hypothetical protein
LKAKSANDLEVFEYLWLNVFLSKEMLELMIYEKKKVSSGRFLYLVVLPVCFLVGELIYLYANFSSDFWNVKFVDVANIIAQFATAGAFYLGFHQYHRTKKVERQAAIISECNSLIMKMAAVSKEFDVGEKTNFPNVKRSCIKLGNLASDFDVLFTALNEGVQKAIVRMHWQEMYFNELQHVMQSLELSAALSISGENRPRYHVALAYANEKAKDGGVSDELKRYFIFREVLSSYIKAEIVDFKFEFSDLYMFFLFFFESDFTNEYMYGSLSRLDARVKSPLIAAIKDSFGVDMEAPSKEVGGRVRYN